ncbi:hypothetical protein HWV62_6729 [Athelia sp. TMB]|nr:hypothetical protein HWV62_6729 [Athelia sp. TMB]
MIIAPVDARFLLGDGNALLRRQASHLEAEKLAEAPPVKTSTASSPMFLSSPFPPRFKSSKSPQTLPNLMHPQPLPMVTSFDPFSGDVGAPSTNIPLVPSPGDVQRIQISHPIPLRPKPVNLIEEEPNPMLGRSRDSQLYMELLPVIKPLDISTKAKSSAGSSPSPVSRDILALKNVGSSLNFQSGNSDFESRKAPSPPMQTSPPLSSIPSFAQKAVFVKQKPRARQRTRSSRRSVSVGPSPLRSMILPEASSGSEIGSPRVKGKENTSPDPALSDVRASGFGEFGNLPPGARGMMHPYSNPDAAENSYRVHQVRFEHHQEHQAHFEQESLRASANADMASQALRNIVRAVDTTPSGSVRVKRDSIHSKDSRSSAVRSSNSWDSSREAVDLGLLGLDRFKWNADRSNVSEGAEGQTEEASCGDGNGKSDSEIDFASFWEQARIIEDIERRRSVGLAW